MQKIFLILLRSSVFICGSFLKYFMNKIRIIIILNILIYINTQAFSETFVYKRFNIISSKINKNEIDKIIIEIDKIEKYFSDIFDYIPLNSIDIIIFDDIYSMTDTFKIPYWIGGYYIDNKIFLQPIRILIKKNVLSKVLFIEYTHYFIDSLTDNNCPGWFNEMLSYYYYALYAGDKVFENDFKAVFYKFDDFCNLKKNINDFDKIKAFYLYSYKFASFLDKNRGIIFKRILSDMKNNINLNKSFINIYGKSIKYVFEEEFLKTVR